MLSEIAAYLHSNSLGTVGTDIFIGQVPDEPDLCTMLFEYGGSPVELTLDNCGDEIPSLQVRVRAARNSYGAGIARIKAVQTLLHGLSNTALSGTTYRLIRANSSPTFIGRDESGRPEWTQNYTIIKEI